MYFGILHSKSVIMIGVWLVFSGGGGLPLFLSGFKMKYSIRLEDDFIDFSDYLDMP